MMPCAFIRAIVLAVLGQWCFSGAIAAEPAGVDGLIAEASRHLYSAPEKGVAPIAKLLARQATFTPAQSERFYVIYASSLGFSGKHEERIALVQSIIGQVTTPARRATLLYQLVDGNTALGKYEDALDAMNKAILLLPVLEKTGDKIQVLQSAFTLLSSLSAYDEALAFAERIYSLHSGNEASYAKCIGLADKVEVLFLSGNNQLARTLVQDAILACDANNNQFITLIVRTLRAIDLIDSADYSAGIATSLPLLQQYSAFSSGSDYVTQLEEAVARAYFKTGNMARAEHYGVLAHERAQSGKALLLQEKTSETMAAIKRAQGQLASALGYYDINLALKKKVLSDELHKNLAYQRVKFETQDKANQMALLAQKNKNMGIEGELQKGRYQNLVLLLTLGLVALLILGAWLFKTLQQRSAFRRSAQVDGLTQVSNRSHFAECAQLAFKNTNSNVSLVLFDMDFFKKVNDTFGHPAGDWVLKTVSDTVKAQLRKADVLGRLGGEEFALCLPLSTSEEAQALAERCRTAIAAIDTGASGFSFPITASFGVATRGKREKLNFEETLAAADKALYLSKNEGRNRVTVYQQQ